MYWFIYFLISLVAAPLLVGIINKVKAFFAGRKGPRLLQLYFDIFKLLKKDRILSNTSTIIMEICPIVNLTAIVVASALMPIAGYPSPLGFEGDIILFFYLFGLGRIATIFAALDTGSAFEGMGASREAQFSAIVELVIFTIITFLALISTGGFSLDLLQAVSIANTGVGLAITPLLLITLAFLIVLLCENCRVPFDDPETHLELTMIHEAMILDNAGPDLAIIHYAAALKLWTMSGFLVMLILPKFIFNGFITVCCYIIGIIVIGAFIGVVESILARARFVKIPQLILSAFTIALIAILLHSIFRY
ncbi:MAG: NADH-quinone oxidoreductase subunit H [Kiritimatiellae bacterium]|nr:NADH-quinone oxidoreductase subunit H [Kiritimatiellia bacterium]